MFKSSLTNWLHRFKPLFFAARAVKAKELQKFSIRFSQIALQEEKGSSSGILAFSDFEYNQNEIEKL